MDVYLSTEELAALEERFGQPDVLWVRQAVSADELRTVRASRKFGRRHDVTLFIFDEAGRLAVIRKPFFPPGAYRAPSGGVRPGESILAGMVREGLEE
ncbi:MAG: NUDIX hydrolase, partial [Clostridia bacterium]|nr:NUDIX hydrolase [Clostridia bacterium]